MLYYFVLDTWPGPQTHNDLKCRLCHQTASGYQWLISSAPKTARQSVKHFIDRTVAVCWHHGMQQRRQRYLISAGNNQNNLREEYLFQVLPFTQHCLKNFTQCSLIPPFTPRTKLSNGGSTVQEAKVRWEATDVAYKVTGVCELDAIWALSDATKNGVRKDKRRTSWKWDSTCLYRSKIW